jgi:uncharacterized repeat protein (TIGR04042 family)
MPALLMALRWPDGSTERVYSPSTVVRDFFIPGKSYEVEDFLQLSRRALLAASERVLAVHGAPCRRAAASLHGIEMRAAAFAGGRVLFAGFERVAGP